MTPAASWQIGGIRITSLVEQELTDLERLIPGATRDVVAGLEWLRPHFVDDRGVMRGLIQAFVVETPERKILVDTCVGNDKDRPAIESWHRKQRPFLKSFEAAGHVPASIDVVLCTHMHFDHVGWNTYLEKGKWKPTFPNAEYLFAEDEFRHWEKFVERPALDASKADSEPEMIAALLDAMTRQTRIDSIVPIVEAGLSRLVPQNYEVCPGVRLSPTPGHTPGHVSVEICSQDRTAFVTGDAIHHPVQIGQPQLYTIADSSAEEARTTRERILARLADSETLLIGSHFSRPTAGRVHADANGFRFA